MTLLEKTRNHLPFGKHPAHNDFSSLHSNNAASSIHSFYTTVTEGSKVPKRRRAPVSTLGQAELSAGTLAPYKLPAGVEILPPSGTALATHIVTLKDKKDAPKVSLLIHNYATEETGFGEAFYSNIISGEVRLILDKPEDIRSIDVWVGSQAGSSVFVFEPHALKMHAHLWPGETHTSSKKFEPGTYSFKFSFEPLPEQIQVKQDMKAFAAKHDASIALPPSFDLSSPWWYGSIVYDIGVDIKYGMRELDDHLDTRFKYEPRFRAAPKPNPLPVFPLITNRNEWPFERESMGGWSITPFGARGRWNKSTMIEVEGLLGIRDPTVAHPGDELDVVLLLWSDHQEALAELAKPGSVELSILRTNILGSDALVPTSRARKNRRVWPERDVIGVMWTEEGSKKVGSNPDDAASVPILHREEENPSSPTLSEDEVKELPGQPGAGHLAVLHGSVPVAVSEGKVTPSFRYQNIAIEASIFSLYLVHVLIRHPNYTHLSPSAPGIEGEAPVWVVTGPRIGTEPVVPTEHKFYGESVVALNEQTKRFPSVTGKLTDKLRPEWDDILAGQGFRMYNY
ncbi:hypothetical protein RhiJN_03607 [Ceratobasidium sp. AG-Ba]|nr:hypothetical protein RhiJN_03607 [Ceratobasidium sp. AG-Ba]QRW04502.1 hypothetical protein RhiLY_03501 [Ceratobasidium sp. AG-Ba]